MPAAPLAWLPAPSLPQPPPAPGCCPQTGLKREWEQAAKYQLLSGASLPSTHLENDTQATQGEGGDERHAAS